MRTTWGAAVVHDKTAYFSSGRCVYAYTIPEDKWSKLKSCIYKEFCMAVVNHKLTTIGGRNGDTATNTLLCLFGISPEMTWEDLLPPMPTKRVRPAAVTTPTHLVVAGGRTQRNGAGLSTVEVLNLHTLQWTSPNGTPEALVCPSMTLCGEHVYLSGDGAIFSCSMEELIKSSKTATSTSSNSVWARLPNTPTYYTTLVTLRGHVLTVGGSNKQYDGTPTGAIHRYDRSTNSWSTIGEMPIPRYRTLVTVLPSNELVVVGGDNGPFSWCSITEIAYPYNSIPSLPPPFLACILDTWKLT